MKKTNFIVATALLGMVLAAPVAANAETAAVYESNGVVTFTPNTDPTNPTDPLDPDPNKPIIPVDPTNPDGPNPGTQGPLSIDYASSLTFGSNKISTKDEEYFATAQAYTDQSGTKKTGPNFVQVTDNRGSKKGWTLNVKQVGQFTNAAGEELEGALITFMNGNIVTNSKSPKPSNTKSEFSLVPDGSAQLVMSAQIEEGSGTYLMDWGNDVESASESIKLEVPGDSEKTASTYTTKFTWELLDVPTAEIE